MSIQKGRKGVATYAPAWIEMQDDCRKACRSRSVQDTCPDSTEEARLGRIPVDVAAFKPIQWMIGAGLQVERPLFRAGPSRFLDFYLHHFKHLNSPNAVQSIMSPTYDTIKIPSHIKTVLITGAGGMSAPPSLAV